MTAKSRWQLAAGLLTAVIALALAGPGTAQETAAPDKAAVVNGVAISRSDLDREIGIYMRRTGRQLTSLPEAQQQQVRAEILESLIDQELLYQESRKQGIQISDEKVNGQLAAIKARYPNEIEFQKALIAMQMSEVEAKRQIERGMAIRELIDQKVAAGVQVQEADSKAFYEGNPQLFVQPERVKASHILLKIDPQASNEQKTEARRKLEDIRKQAEGGANFAELARANSEGPSSTRGGDLGFFQRGQMVKAFEEAAFGLEKDQLSGIVETRFGYHLIKVTDRQPEKKLTYEEVKEPLTARLRKQKVEQEARRYIDALKKDAKIERLIVNTTAK